MAYRNPEPNTASHTEGRSWNFQPRQENDFNCEINVQTYQRGAHLITLRNLFSEQECADIISGFASFGACALATNPHRNRVVAMCESLSACMLQRLQAQVASSPALASVFQAQRLGSCWVPGLINPVWRYVETTSPFGKLGRHYDATVIRTVDEASLYSVLLYLNSDYAGGELTLLEPPSPLPVRLGAGDVVLLDQRLLHEGSQVTQGTKLFCRSEILHRRSASVETARDREGLALFEQARCDEDGLEARAYELSPALEDLVLQLD